jgi:sugar phosphate isomerase/epimerase
MPRIHCSILTLPDDLGTAAKLRMIAEAGFDGVQASPPSPAARASFADAVGAAGLEASACGYLAEEHPAEPLFEATVQAGMTSLNLQVAGYWRDDAWHDARVRELITLSETYHLPFFLETHRHRMTQDPRRTLSLLNRHPDLQLCGDFSHYTSAGELAGPWPGEWRDMLHTLAARCGEVHIRLNNGQNIQDPLCEITPEQQSEFLALWRAAGAQCPDLLHTTELLPSSIGYDRPGRDIASLGDIWSDSVRLLSMLRGA